MNDDFSFDGAAAADMPLDLSSSSLSLPEGGAATGFHLPDMEPAQEQVNADSPNLADEWRQDVQMFDGGGLNELEESAGSETVASLDAESPGEDGSTPFNPQLTDTDSVRRQGAALMKGMEERIHEKARDRQSVIVSLLRAGRNDQEALKRLAERWGEDSVSRLLAANDEDRSYMLGMRLAEVLGDGDSDVGFQIYKNTHNLWGKGIVSPEQVWKDFAERGKEIVEREDRLRVERERKISDLNGVVGRYVSGEQDALSADERLALFNAGVSVASMEKARRGVRLIESFEQDSKLYNDDIADDLFGIIGNDDDSLMMLCNLLRNRSRSTANDRLGMGDADKRADEAYQKVMENSNPMIVAMAGPQIQNAKMASGIAMSSKVASVKTKRSLERALQNMQSNEDAHMKAAAFQVSVAKARQMGLSDEEAFELAGVQEQERCELQQKRNRIFSALTTALEGGEDDYFSSEASSLSKVGYHLGSMTGDTAPWFVPYAGPLIGLNTSMQRRREEGYMLGLDVDEIEKRAFWFGAADTAEEMIGFHALFKVTPLYKGVRKLLQTGKGSGVRALVSGSPTAQYVLQGLAGTVEEGVLEPTAGYLMRAAINPLLDDERGKQTWEQYTSELSQTTSGEQGLALLAFSFGLSGLNYSQLSRAAKEFRLSLKSYEALGGTAQGYLEAREEKTAEGFLNKALANLHGSWMEDPQSAMERARTATGERLSSERIESLRELDAWRAAETAGMVPRVEPAEQEGMFRVYAPSAEKGRPEAPQKDSATYGQQQEGGKAAYTLMDGEQMTAYLQAFVSEQVENDILYTQNMLAGDVAVSQALAQRRFDAAEVITRTEVDEQTGAERVVIAPETLGQMKARADMAMAAIRALEAEGVSYQEAAARIDTSLSEHIPLGSIVAVGEQVEERIRTEQARNPEFNPESAASRAYVVKFRKGDTFRRVLRHARGSATVEDLMEETMEQAVISWQAEQNMTWGELGTMLQEAQKSINDLFPEARGKDMQFIHLDAGKPVTGHDAIEAFSKIGRSRWLADALNNTSLPSWLRKLLNHLVKFLGAFKARVELSEMVRQAEEQGVFTLPVRQALAVMLDAGNALYRDQQGDLIALTMERAKAQADLDAALGRGVATEQEAVEEQLAERNASDEPGPVDRAQEEADDANAQQARRERTEAEVEMLGEQDDDGVFNGGVSIRIEDGVRQGFIDKDRLTLCPDVPQFKQGADEKTGVVNRIVGAWQRNAAPISVWRRTDGSLQVISGRHRLDACTDADINCTVYEEGDRFDLAWARRHDVENNIRDGQASAFEIARYVRESSLSMAEAVERGIARKGASLKGVELGLYSSQELLDALGNGLVSPDDAYRVALAFRNDAEVQRSGLAVLLDGGSWQEAYNTMAAKANLEAIARQNAANGMDMGMDLFGNTDNEELYKRIGKYAAEKYRELGKELTAINGASRNPKVARKYGVNVNDAAAVQQVVKRLQEERARWKNFAVHPDLLKEANDAVMVDENGEPLVVYHGSNAEFTVFDPSLGGINYGKYEEDYGFVFTTSDFYDASIAAENAREFENERRVAYKEDLLTKEDQKEYSLFVNLRNPLVYHLEDNPFNIFNDFDKKEPWVWDLPEFSRKARSEYVDGDQEGNEYDGIILKGESSTWALAISPEQIKSATDNRGTYDPKNPDITFSIRTEEPPKNTGIGYKVFYQKNGKLYPPMVANPDGKDTPVGVWLDADEGVRAGVSKTGRPRVKAGGKGTQGGSGTLAYRPGWHLGEIPYALQFNRRNPQTGERDLFPADFVWAEVEYAADHDYQEEAMSHGINPAGKFQHSLAGLPRIPKDGFYRYRTNPNPQTDPWIITGAIKVRRVLSKAEVDDLVRQAGREPQITFSIIGEKAESFLDYHNNGLSYTDPADGKRKAIIDSRGVRLKKERIGLSEGGHVNVSLAAALDFPELFRAYPKLRKLRVDFYRDSKSNTGGFTDPQGNYIAVNLARGRKDAASGMVLDTILHEVQHVIQGYEGFALGAGGMNREQALAYLGESMKQLRGRDDDWAKEALPRLTRMKSELEEGTLQPAFIYTFSHGEQEARLAGRFNENGTGVVMSGLNGFRLLDASMFSIPLTGNITELGGITFGNGRFGRMADRILSPNGDWLYDEMVFKMRAATQRSVSKLNLYEAGDRERGLELLAEAQELIATVERFLPHTYGFGLEPYKIWLNVFTLLYGNSGRMAPDETLASALSAIPMKKWPDIMAGSVMNHFWAYVKQDETLGPVWEDEMKRFKEEAKFAEAKEKAAELDKRRWEFFVENGAEFLEEYGEQKVYRLIGKFMCRVVEQIDRYRKDRTLGRIRRVVASVAPRTNPKGKPLLGKMDAETYRKLEKYMRLLEMTESQYDEFFQKNYPEDAKEGKRWEDLPPDALVQVTLPDAEGELEEVTVTQREFEAYACYEQMDVNTAEKCGAALGEFISTSRHAWENAAEKKKLEIAAMAAPVLQATGELDDNRMATIRRKARLRALPKKPLSLFDYLMNFNQYMQALSSVEPFAAIARQFEERAARFNVQRQASEKDMLGFVHNTVAEIVESADRYDIAEWIYEGRMKQDTGITVVEREPDWNKKANALYRERFLHLLRRKVKSHGLEAVQLYLKNFSLSEDLRKEVNAMFGHRRKEISAKQAEKALKHLESVFTEKEWKRYGDQELFVTERVEMLRSGTKFAKEEYQPKSYRLDGLSRMEAAYLVLLSEQADYTDALAERGFDAAVMDQLREFAGDEVMRFAYQLREKLNERSGQVQEMTEKRYGTPFPLAENYFRAFFDVTMEAIDKSIADAASYGEAATGGKYGMIRARRKHKAHLDLEMDVCTAFMAAMTEQDLYLYGSEISRDLRALLNFKGEAGEAGRSLEVLLGRDAVGKLMAWADAFDRAGAESIRGHLDMNRLMNRLSGAAARALLSGRVGTLTKQATTVINAMYASDEISLSEWLGAVRRYHAGKLVKPVSEIEALPELDSRDKTRFSATLAAMGADEAGRQVSRLERWNREGMDLLERVDMKGNAISAAILYDAVYRKAKRETPDATDAELDAVAMAEVRRSLSRKGQPMTQLQKSLAAQHRTWMQVGMLFLGGESINTIGNVFSLARSGQWGKAGLMWVSHGMVLAILNGLLNFMTDDEKRRRKREWWHALFDVVMGPVMGIPVVSGLAGEGVRQLAKLCGYNAFMPGNNLLVPFSNAADIGKAFSNAWKVFDGKERPWEDDALSFHELLRTAAAGTVAFSPRTTKGGAAAVGAALTMAALLNVTEFALKTVRSVQENGADWGKWAGNRK